MRHCCHQNGKILSTLHINHSLRGRGREVSPSFLLLLGETGERLRRTGRDWEYLGGTGSIWEKAERQGKAEISYERAQIIPGIPDIPRLSQVLTDTHRHSQTLTENLRLSQTLPSTPQKSRHSQKTPGSPRKEKSPSEIRGGNQIS